MSTSDGMALMSSANWHKQVHSSGSPALRKPSITIDEVGANGVSVRSHLIVS